MTTHCRQPGCPGHDSELKVCVDPALYGSPYAKALKDLLYDQEMEIWSVQLRHAEQRLKLAHRYSRGTEYSYWLRRVRALRSQREKINATAT